MTSVSFQGERGAYSQAAALSYFDETIETVPLPTFADIISNTESTKTEYCILPVENSLEGSIGESYDLLLSTKLNVVGEVYHRIKHCLIGFDTLDKIDEVYSHPQALGQCRKFIQENELKKIPTYDTAGSVQIIKNLNKKNVACIASKIAADIYKVSVIKESIEDNSNNYTRFLILSKKDVQETGKDKTSIIFSIKHEAGALFKILKQFQDLKINLTKIESRPNKSTPWEYNFYVDFEGNSKEPQVSEVLKKIEASTLFLKILGSYPIAQLN